MKVEVKGKDLSVLARLCNISSLWIMNFSKEGRYLTKTKA